MAHQGIGTRSRTPEEAVRRSERIAQGEGEVLEAAVGAVAGGVAGIFAGPVGIAAGVALGAAAGAALGHQIRKANHEEAEHARALDSGDVELPEEPIDSTDPGSLERLSLELDAAPSTRTAPRPVP